MSNISTTAALSGIPAGGVDTPPAIDPTPARQAAENPCLSPSIDGAIARSPRRISPTGLVILCGLYFSIVLSSAMWRRVFAQIEGGVTASPLLTMQLAGFVVFLTLFVLVSFRFRYVLKPVLALLLVASATAAYFMNTYGVLIDGDMLRNAIQTDRFETAGLLSWTLAAYVVGLGIVPAWLVIRAPLRWNRLPATFAQNVGLALLFLALALGSAFVDFKAAAPFLRVNGKEMRWRAAPLNLLASTWYLVRDANAVLRPTEYRTIAQRAAVAADVPDAARNLVILVVGETARAMNFSLNGYARATNPELASLPVTSFTNVRSCGTSTAVSVPCMFSNLGRDGYSSGKADNRENLLDLAKRAGYDVIWIDNQAGSKGVSDRVAFRQLQRQEAGAEETSDEAFIDELDHLLSGSTARTLLVFHQMGSHGPEYYKRSTTAAKRFLPECIDKQLEHCPSETIVNAYDNTIVQTDRVLAAMIRKLTDKAADRAVTMVYVSDHGESLGENGLFLHGLPYSLSPPEQTAVPMIFWANQMARAFTGVGNDCVADLRDKPLSHDNLFHTVMGLLRIDSDAYRIGLDAFDDCRLP